MFLFARGVLWWDTAPTWSDKYGSTLFMVMAEHGEAATVDVLLDDKAGADLSIVDNESIPALLWCRKSSRCVNGYGSASRKRNINTSISRRSAVLQTASGRMRAQ